MKIVADNHIPYIKEYFGSFGDLILKDGRRISAADVKDATILLVRSITHVDQNLLQGSKVKFVGSVTAGADHLDTHYLHDAGIDYSVAQGFNAPPVADYVVSVIAALQKKELLTKKKMRAAVIGIGNVGGLVVERFNLLHFDLVLCDPFVKKEDFKFASLDELTDLDVISLHVPLTKTGEHPTYHFINKEFLKRQKPGCVLINASRGAVIHTKDLLQYGTHLHWCFDVWEHEPKINKEILQQTLIATPHIAGYSVQSKIRGIDMIYRIACDKKFIQPQSFPPIIMPKQQLSFSEAHYRWQDIVLGVFNPQIISTMMHTMFMQAEEYGHLFDEMRNQFNYRYEYNFTDILDSEKITKEKDLLKKLGFCLR